ncbi:RluA family pseudouridine synthase [Opitutaceae bacterium]|nr:RluA family pseudouridine synthase [Opitutaceae bacterium]
MKLTSPEELATWVIHEDEDLLVVNKSGEVVCHPSKFGPTSSLVGAAREYLGIDTVHLVFRLDRETSGVVVMAKNPTMASRLQKAMQTRKVGKRYLTLLHGELHDRVMVDQPLGPEVGSPVYVKDHVRPDGKEAQSEFIPLTVRAGFTAAEVRPRTGRKHQIRAHAQWLGHTVVGDKIYGPDANLFLRFIDDGWGPELERQLLIRRQALHCAEIDLRPTGLDWVFRADWPADLAQLTEERLSLPKVELS